MEVCKQTLKLLAEVAKLELTILGAGGVVTQQGELRFLLFRFDFEELPRAGDRIALIVQEPLDAEGHLDVATTEETLTGSALVGLELRELAFPEAKDVGGDVAEPGDLADAESRVCRGSPRALWTWRRCGWRRAASGLVDGGPCHTPIESEVRCKGSSCCWIV